MRKFVVGALFAVLTSINAAANTSAGTCNYLSALATNLAISPQSLYPSGVFQIGNTNRTMKNMTDGDFDAISRQLSDCASYGLISASVFPRLESAVSKARSFVHDKKVLPLKFEIRNLDDGHILSEDEIKRLQAAASAYPELLPDVQRLFDKQANLKTQAEEQERRKAADATDEARKELERKLAAQRAEDEQRAAEVAFNHDLPGACKDAETIKKELSKVGLQNELAHALALARAGDSQGGCPSLQQLTSRFDKLRVTFIQCSKQLDLREDLKSKGAANNALNSAINLHDATNELRNGLQELGCQ